MEPFLLPPELDLPGDTLARLTSLYSEGLLSDPGISIPEIALREFNIDLSAKYGPLNIAHPIGKASGQLSLQEKQVRADAEAGIAFVVLKTVIAEDEAGSATMEAWKIREPRMVVERIRGRRTPRDGWTVSWAGRGWEGSLESYLEFTKAALSIGKSAGMPVIPSCKYNLPSNETDPFRNEEYDFTTQRLVSTWRDVNPEHPLTLEQDFSPTLAGTNMAQSKRLILKWLSESPRLIKKTDPAIILGVKLMNAVFDDDYQLEMVRTMTAPESAADFLICFNRLFDPDKEFGSKKGIAYGGPDLSDRNLTLLSRMVCESTMERKLPISATGDIISGRMMVEYALRGATSGQLHTYFQLPSDQYTLKGVSRSRAALHELYFHPSDGILAAMLHLQNSASVSSSPFRFLDLPAMGGEIILRRGEEGE